MRIRWRAPLFFILPGAAVLLVGARSAQQEEQTNPTFSQSLKDKFIVAVPRFKGNVFERSVIFMVGHDARGAFGLIVNNPTSSVPRGRHRGFDNILWRTCFAQYGVCYS